MSDINKCVPVKKVNKGYQNGFLKYGFYHCFENNVLKPLCLICKEKFSENSYKQSNLKRHQNIKHPETTAKDEDYFRALILQNSDEPEDANTTDKYLEASYKIALNIVKAGKCRSIGEKLIKPSIKDAVAAVMDDEAAEKISKIPLSRDTVKRRIESMANWIQEKVIGDLLSSPTFSLQLDESTDVAGLAELLVYVRYIKDGGIEENFLLCKPLITTTTGLDIFQLLNEYFNEKHIEWTRCSSICTDGAPALTGVRAGFIAQVKKVNPHVQWTHCFLHREALAARCMEPELKETLDIAVQVINLIKASAKNTRIFTALCEELDANFTGLLLHTEERWLSRGRALNRLFELRKEVAEFLSIMPDKSRKETSARNTKKTTAEFKNMMNDENSTFLTKLAYLCDIFQRLNELNLSLQGDSSNVFEMHSKVLAVKRKLLFFVSKLERGDLSCFPVLQNHLAEIGRKELEPVFKKLIESHLKNLRCEFYKYFPNDEIDNVWILNPFVIDLNNLPGEMSSAGQEQLLTLASDVVHHTQFKTMSFIEFWLTFGTEFQELFDIASRVLLKFSTSYLCEKAFSAMLLLKNKYRNRLDVEDDLRIYLFHKNVDRVRSPKPERYFLGLITFE